MLRELERRLAVADVSDEELVAFVDGELDEVANARVAEALAGDAELSARAERLRATRAPLQQAFDAVLREPLPQALIDFVRNSPQGSHLPQDAGLAPAVVRFERPSRRQAEYQPRGPRLLQMAAGLALLIVAGAGGWLLRPLLDHGENKTQLAVGQNGAGWAVALQSALEGAPTGADFPIGGADRADGSVKVVSTFLSRDHRYCRQYAVELEGSNLFDGLACRAPQGGWLVEHQMRRAAQPNAQSGLRPAAGRARQALDATVDEMIDGGVLGADEERRLLESRWSAGLRDR